LIIGTILGLAAHAMADGLIEAVGYGSRPRSTPSGVLLTNNYSSALYLAKNEVLLEVFSAPGCGKYVSLSPDRALVGFKQITAGGKQVPSTLDLRTNEVRPLYRPVDRAGQVSFTRDGRIAFTAGENVILQDGSISDSYDLGVYANIAPISPDGTHIAYNDRNDQIWLLELRTGMRWRITSGLKGYYEPQWSPDGRRVLYSSLHGSVYVYHLATGGTRSLGKGYGPTWSEDSRMVAFHRLEIYDGVVSNSDLFMFDTDKEELHRITETPRVCEMDPSFDMDGRGILFHTYGKREIGRIELGAGWIGVQALVRKPDVLMDLDETLTIPLHETTTRLHTSSTMDIPYVHQVYDTPDWFNGHWACAPTQAIMLLAFYDILPPWQTWCSWPSPGHWSSWGNYVAEQYYFRETDYWQYAYDPSDKAARGGYGYMWSNSFSPHSRMAHYFRKHGLEATQTESTPYRVALAEIQAGYPYSMCVMLTSAGHLVLAHGVGTEPHTFVFNDPYGDKNSGYMNYSGKNVMYDWPGYNNGNQNLNGVAWCIATRNAAVASVDTLVDDLHFGQGFYLHTQRPASMELWKDRLVGYKSHMWWTTTRSGLFDSCYAVWTPDLPRAGDYEVLAHIPFSNATSASYRVHHAAGDDLVVVNQKEVSDSWLSLGTFWFPEGSEGYVRLGDKSDVPGQEIVFDAIRWTYRGTPVAVQEHGSSETPSDFALYQNSPNPFNPTTTIRYTLPAEASVTLEIYSALGQKLSTLVNQMQGPGLYSTRWTPAGSPSGVYFLRFRAVDPAGRKLFADTKKMLLAR
jgi:hypothetical protein